MQKKNRATRRLTTHYKNTLFLSMLVLIPVAIVSAVNFLILYSNNMKTTQNDLRMEAERTLQTLNTNLNSMSKIVSLKRMDKIFSVEAQAEMGSAYYPIIQELKKDAMWTSLFSTLSYYNTQSGLVYRMSCAETDDEYFGKDDGNSAYYASDSLGMQTWDRKKLEEPGNHTRAMRIHNADGKGNGDGVLLAVPLELRSNSSPLSYMLFTISDNTLFNIVNASEGTTCILYYNDIPIYSSDPEICKSLYEGQDVPETFNSSNAIMFSNDGIRISWDISRGFLMQKLIPTIILEAIVTFIVMVVGLMLMLYISRKNYEPIQNLLKKLPPRSDEEYPMDEFKYINFALDDLTYSKHFFEESVQELRREKYLFYILDNQVEPGMALYDQCLHEGIRVDRSYFACILMEDSEKNYSLFEKLASEETNETNINIYSLYIMENKYLFLLASDIPKQEFQSFLSGLSQNENELVRISEVIEGIQNVRRAYTSVCWPEREKQPSQNTVSRYPLVEIQLLQEATETENIDKVEFALRMIKNDLKDYNANTRKGILKKVYVLLCPGNPTENLNLPEDTAECGQLLDQWLMQFVGGKGKTVSVKKTLPRNLHTIMHFIEEHFTSPEFSIKYMAAVFGTSPSNLSHQFKNLTGKTLSRFIDELRISKAEEMLATGEKIQTIAQKLGYSTTPVFTETYKRLRGITPSQYRSQLQQKNRESEQD